ncbi:conserved uncharacterized protein MchI [Erwinia pyrifoliae Ep1/96]|nr:hypothetical protein CPI84_10145 [Erwinia pyrifoliae]MCA8876929.1 hypothetical protein [Erwinia pyrifoliae]CAX55483.1 conserved uncharacterized protein MchI [Erwinia pyrifoliae Ep1/96]
MGKKQMTPIFVKKIPAILIMPLTILAISFSSMRIIGDNNSLVDVFLAVIIYLGFANLFKIIISLTCWFNGKSS